MLGHEIRPLERVGVYIPGGRAAYPSTVLMTALPARVVGVREIVLVTPPDADGRVAPAVLAAARLAGITEAYRIGGPGDRRARVRHGHHPACRQDRGPGNVYVAVASGGSSARSASTWWPADEVLVVADASADAEWIAADPGSRPSTIRWPVRCW